MRQAFNDDPRLRFFIGDVRDFTRLTRAMIGVDVVIHAAALKRIEVGNYCPDEMVKTNINGSSNVIEAAYVAKVHSVVALSTDKAWQSLSPYGQSKALAESLFLNANHVFGESGPNFSVTRFGNVWGSTGSVVPAWKNFISKGIKKVPVTDPDCTRFFMRKEEAVELVSCSVGKRELIIPSNLLAYRIGDLAEAMNVEMDIKGLPEWEKKHEGLRDGYTSDQAKRMSVEELCEVLKHG